MAKRAKKVRKDAGKVRKPSKKYVKTVRVNNDVKVAINHSLPKPEVMTLKDLNKKLEIIRQAPSELDSVALYGKIIEMRISKRLEVAQQSIVGMVQEMQMDLDQILYTPTTESNMLVSDSNSQPVPINRLQ